MLRNADKKKKKETQRQKGTMYVGKYRGMPLIKVKSRYIRKNNNQRQIIKDHKQNKKT